jgi:2-alkyl-3-oxoalkanoate reductase
MKVFVAGATGAIGSQLVPQLAAAGHDVIAMTRSPAKTDMLRALGARPVVADALDPDAVAGAVAETEPEVIVHQLTALKGNPGLREMRNLNRFAAMTNRLRTEGTEHLLAAGGPSASVASSPRASWPSAPMPAPATAPGA